MKGVNIKEEDITKIKTSKPKVDGKVVSQEVDKKNTKTTWSEICSNEII